MFGREDLALVGRLKQVLNKMARSKKARHRKTVNAYKTLYRLNCYFSDVAALEPVALKLEGENLWRVTLSHGDKALTPRCLVESGKSCSPS